ncbi:unnamed protein product [Cladocopium goreaui]|uniref:Uncharacterized protein n=1 Tax=Cladocopium goreaui TaxID=2562237 RepID=A0A9P1GK29_9DINO|nr:unnamed protein product [Cladocopium goreaui]
MIDRVEFLTADGAPDEQLALAAMSGSLGTALFPNIKATCRDLCHSVRRIGKRPSYTDSFLKETFLDCIPRGMVFLALAFKVIISDLILIG